MPEREVRCGMKFNFKVQDYQSEAVEAVVRVFQGQPLHALFTCVHDPGVKKSGWYSQDRLLSADGVYDQAELTDIAEDTGVRNADIVLSDAELLSNIRGVQLERNIHGSSALTDPLGRCSLDVEMETGTGKTYVYIKTMFELNKRYGWSKFIVVVPSIAIREGVKKSFEITVDHFMAQYGKKARFFIYNSGNLNQLDMFACDAGINVMIINTQAFAASLNEAKNVEGRKGDAAARIIYTKRDEFGSRRPIDVIAETHPILILDEPQKMGKENSVTQQALKKFAPLFTLNYSATHAKHHDLVYVLDALDAYNKRLVKRIEVKGFEKKNLRGTDKYLYLEEIRVSSQKPPRARIELEVMHQNGPKREFRLLDAHDSLYYASNRMEQYKGLTISEIDPVTGIVRFTNGDELQKGMIVGDVSETDMRRAQIRETILSHFEKEQELYKMGIKTLSLFFIDEVAKYRQYDENGQELLGEYGKIFEEEYLGIMNEHRTLFDPAYMAYLDAADVRSVHCGYFSIDKKTKRSVDSPTKRGSDMSDDVSAYDLIMKMKERLLSFDEPTRFIFSHSALREGWDNPNVFQICTLKHSDSTTQRRQEVGRGLRLCVDQAGNRMDREVLGDRVQDVNLLTVIANETYADFVGGLQKQTEAVLYERPQKASKEYFLGKLVHADGKAVKIDDRQARAIYQYLVRSGYIDEDDRITKDYREDAEAGALAPMPESLRNIEADVHTLIRAIYDENALKAMFEDGNKTRPQENPLNERFAKEEFQKLWKMINHKYAYTVNFDSEELIKKAVECIDNELEVSRLQYTISKAKQKETISASMLKENDSFYGAKNRTKVLKYSRPGRVRYDLLGKIAEGTVLTRKTVAEILSRISTAKFALYKENPEEFMTKVIRLIKGQKATMIVDHITYDTIEGSYDSSIFTAEKHMAMDRAYPAKKAIQDYVFTDGTAEKSVEREFAEGLDGAEEVYIYAKLPKGFYIPTPVGHYSPDWAVVFHEGAVQHIYFVAETKGSLESMDLRPIEKSKIDCAKKLFSKLSDGRVIYEHVTKYDELLKKAFPI